MTARSGAIWLGLATLGLVWLIVVPSVVGAANAAGFDAYIQSGTCAAPTDDLRVALKSDGPHDVAPYVAKGANGEPVTLGYYGAPEARGFGVAAVYTDRPFSMVIADTDTGDAVACGDILRPDTDRYRDAGVAVIQLVPVASGTVHGIATLEQARMQRESDVTPARARIVLSTEAGGATAPAVEGYDGYIQSGQCSSPTTDIHVKLKSKGDHDVKPFVAQTKTAGEPVTVAYYGAPTATGFGFAATYTSQEFSLVISDTNSGSPMACGAILEPDADKYTEAGIALVQLSPVDSSGVQGFALVDRAPLQRESDVTPTLVRILLFAPPISGA